MFAGMEMMLKAAGIDPQALQNLAKEMGENVSSAEKRLSELEAKTDAVYSLLKKIASKLEIEE